MEIPFIKVHPARLRAEEVLKDVIVQLKEMIEAGRIRNDL